ncbi:4Fe-4S binding protein [Yeosuana sp. MJ-SS3]|uniref:4Fe-4S binding protein n=1 Tax=Gilvirhabdus luticola TaxID=3079858 RepID=A0ABU3UA85_9FLAO|nr:4Fe-4S binding protein [Yeosuana sp. MJ-SS3]MDU8887231.1 4Fe-4S binding protein [Yeosuana sp. MJ-SS3]
MKSKNYITVTGNEVVAKIAYQTNEVCAIYPITPASEMGELVEQWSAENKQNIFGSVPTVFEMQSEAGVAGSMHGALQTGSLSTTFTASQGLLLMMPNMYKIAGELTPNVIHVATRSIATHALSVFNDHSDIMAVRSTGYAMLGAASVQEAQDFALISQAATLKSRIPFVHFFDGFRTSHETSKIEAVSENVLQEMMDIETVYEHNNRALNPNDPIIRGTSQTSDVFFQSREAINSFYDACPDIVQNTMDKFYELTGRQYKLFDYVGHPETERLIISMASSTETIEETINQLIIKGEKVGLVKVRLFRPFSVKHLVQSIPLTVRSIAVLDRTKEPGASAEPLYLDVVQSLSEAFQNKEIKTLPRIVGGRYGLSSKEFTPSMVKAVFKNLQLPKPKNNFTIGIHDDVTNLSLSYNKNDNLYTETYQALFYQSKIDKNGLPKLIGNTKNKYVQSFTECNYNKSDSTSIVHLRIGNNPINAPYLITNADFIACQNVHFTQNDNLLNNIKPEGTLLVNSSLSPSAFWQSLSAEIQEKVIQKNIAVYIVNLDNLKSSYELKSHMITPLEACFLMFKNNKIYESFKRIKNQIHKVNTVIQTNYKSLEKDTAFSETLLGKLLANQGNDIAVSELPVDGTYPTDTSKFNQLNHTTLIPKWEADLCTQCGACSMACPQSALRIKVFDDSYFESMPEHFEILASEDFDLMNYTIQINPEQCNSCNNCIDACPVKALTMINKMPVKEETKENWDFFETIPEFDRTKINSNKLSQQQLQEPLFKYPLADIGCGETPYIKLLSQLFGDRLIVANATGSSSIFGGALPTTPWAKNKDGRGPVWSNSLFEDNAEFGLGFRLSIDNKVQQAKRLLENLLPHLDFNLVYDVCNASQKSEIEILEQRKRVDQLKEQLNTIASNEAKQLLQIIDNIVKKSVWIVGGDGWAYDIGFGGLDHVMASGENVNILILDNEVYDNTGGQASKATPFGAHGKFSFGGKQKQKKDLDKMAMTYNNVYVASVAIGANQEQTLKAFTEAESFNGPSVIIAYCHSEKHGIDMERPSQYHKAAVNSGQWLLYRNDPRKPKAFQMDSEAPSISVGAYLKLQKRFDKLTSKNSKDELQNIQSKIDSRYSEYVSFTTTESKDILNV